MFELRKIWNNVLIFIEYIIREPYYELKELFNIFSKIDILIMYSSIIMFVYLYYLNIRGIILYLLILLILVSWIYGIYKSGDWKKYYREKYF